MDTLPPTIRMARTNEDEIPRAEGQMVGLAICGVGTHRFIDETIRRSITAAIAIAAGATGRCCAGRWLFFQFRDKR